MGRVPFYAYPNSPYSFYGYPAESYYHRPQSQFYPASSSTPRRSAPSSVINVPVHDSTPTRPSSSPPQRPLAASALMDRSSAATTIQSLFRGYCVRRHQPLLHLRTVTKARKELEDLQGELEKPEVSLKLRTSEKERLRFSENVMAIIFRLDGVEGSIAEVRSQRKEATKMAIKLQDAIDAIMMQKDEIAALDPTVDEDVMFESDDAVPIIEQSQQALHSEADMVNNDQGEGHAVSVNASMHVNTLQENPLQAVENVADECMSEIDRSTAMGMGFAEDVASLHPGEKVSFSNQMEGDSGDMELVSQVVHAKTPCVEEEHLLMGETSGSDVAHRNTVATLAADEVGNGGDASHVETCGNHVKNDIQMEGVTCVDNMVDVSDGFAEGETTDGRETHLNVVQEGASEAIELFPGTKTLEEKVDYPHDDDTVHANEGQNSLSSLENLREDNCSVDGHGCPAVCRQGCEERSNEASPIKKINAEACTPSSSQDNASLHQLSENCRQLKALVGKLLVQNKAQSNVMRALAERLEAVERKQQRADRHDRQKMREKRKVKKGLRSSGKYHNTEDMY